MIKISAIIDQFYKLAHQFTVQEALDLFGLNENSSAEDLEKAYKKKVFELHPDRNKLPGAEDDFIKMQVAYNFLKEYKDKPANSDSCAEENESAEEYMPWTRKYHEPIENYDDWEKEEYYHNPDLHKQYETEFQDEQEHGRQNYEEEDQQRWEQDRESAYDRSYIFSEQMRENKFKPELSLALLDQTPEKILEAFKILSIDLPRVYRSNLSNKSGPALNLKQFKKEVVGATGRYLLENHPEFLEQYLENPNHVLGEDFIKKQEILQAIPLDVFKKVYKYYYEIRSLKHDKINELFSDDQFLESFCDHIITLAENNPRFNLLDPFWLPRESKELIKNKMILEFKVLQTDQKIQDVILMMLQRAPVIET